MLSVQVVAMIQSMAVKIPTQYQQVAEIMLFMVIMEIMSSHLEEVMT